MRHIDDLASQMRRRRSAVYQRTTSADRSPDAGRIDDGIGSGLVVVLAGHLDHSVRRSRVRATTPKRCCATTTSISSDGR